ncbi:NusA N-terminal domain-containing protein [Mycoplasma struthionis]|uniref:NusA N-terminal domain-containing protein n=1 Tax=Mycoplasma struthionis TaxID=538220 RepID=UPI0021BD4DBA|nr:NusA N-terminal domain-containing protein [Mycoplasma struthionis]
MTENGSSSKAKEIFVAIYNLAQIKKLDQSVVLNFLEQAIRKLICEQYDDEADLEFIFNEEENFFKIINHNKTVIPDPKTDDEKDDLSRCIEVPLSEAKKIK